MPGPISYTPYYPAGWNNLPDQTTPIIREALNNIESGVTAATAQANAALAAAGSAPNALLYTAQTLTSPQIKQALNNILAMPTLRPEQYGAAADGVTDDSDAFYNCQQAGLAQAAGTGYVIQLQQGAKYYLGTAAKTAHSLNGLFDLTTGCYLIVPGGSGRAGTSATQLIGEKTAGGYIIDTVSSSIVGCGMSGFTVTSNMAAGYSGSIGGVRFSFVAWGHMRDFNVTNVSDIALNINGCVDMHIENIGLQHDVTGRTLTDVTPAFFLSGTDHVLINIQANGGNTNPTLGNLSSGTNFYNPSIQMYNCDAAKFLGVNGEFGDVGWYFGGTSSAVGGGVAATHNSLNEFIDSRGDYNAAHGYYIACGAWNTFTDCFVNNNSNNSNGTYDGVYLVNTSLVLGNRFTQVIGASPVGKNVTCTLSGTTLTATSGTFSANDTGKILAGVGIPVGTTITTYTNSTTVTVSNSLTSGTGVVVLVSPQIMGYYYHDASTGGATQLDANVVSMIGGERQGMAFDYALTAAPFKFAITKGGAGSYIYRPASRYAAGQTWTDLVVPTGPVLTYSDGGGGILTPAGWGGWRSITTNLPVGNLLNSVTTECLGGVTTGWLATTVSSVTTSPPVTTATATLAAVCFNQTAATTPTIPGKLGNTQLMQVTCNAAGVTAGYCEALTLGVVYGIAASTSYAAVVSTVAGTTARNVKLIIDCFNGSTFLSSVTTDTGATNSTTATSTHNFTFTTPASCNEIQVRVRFTGAALGEQHYIGLVSVDTHSTQTIPVYS